MSAPLAKGQRYHAPTMGCTLVVIRVAKDDTWADIRVTTDAGGNTWRKRQPLRLGWFPFPVDAR